MENRLVNKLERLLSELVDEGTTEELIQQIEQLLVNNPELQSHYWSWMDIHVILGIESATILGEPSHSKLSEMLTLDPSRQGWIAERPRARRRNWAIGSILAILICVVGALLMLPARWSLPVANQPAGESAWHIPQITRVSWEGPFFENRIKNDHLSDIPQVGQVALKLTSGRAASGYVLRLNPGVTAELMLAIDAIAENNCSVIEIDSQGTPLRRVVSFNNFQPEIDPKTRRCGLGGTWVAENSTNKPQYFLINGIHKLYHPSSPTADRHHQSFHLSDMRVILDEPDLVVIGWDDGGLDPSEFHGAIRSDDSFDDLTVVIRLRGPGIPEASAAVPRHLREWISPRVHPQSTETPQTDGFERYRFIVQPGELAVLNVGSEAKVMNSLFLVNELSGEILWSINNAGILSNHLGAAVLENVGPDAMHLAVFGECLPPPDNEDEATSDRDWACSEFLKVHGQPNCAILGFRDRVRKGEFVALRVTLMTMSPHRSGLFDEQRAGQ